MEKNLAAVLGGLCALALGFVMRFHTGNLTVAEVLWDVLLVCVFLNAVYKSDWRKGVKRHALTMGLAWFLGGMIFCDMTSHKIWLVDGEIGDDRETIFAVPFLQDIRGISRRMQSEQVVIAKTKDGKTVQGSVAIHLKLASDPSTLKFILRKFPNADAILKRDAEQFLRGRFQETIQRYDLAELTNALIVEWEIGHDLRKRSESIRTLEWEGTIRVTNLHAYFGVGEKVVL